MREGAFAANEALRGHWYAVARADDVGAEPVAVTLLGQRLVLWRSATDGFTAAPDRCPHREVDAVVLDDARGGGWLCR